MSTTVAKGQRLPFPLVFHSGRTDSGIEVPTPGAVPHFPNAFPQVKYLPLNRVLTAVLHGNWTLTVFEHLLHDLPPSRRKMSQCAHGPPHLSLSPSLRRHFLSGRRPLFGVRRLCQSQTLLGQTCLVSQKASRQFLHSWFVQLHVIPNFTDHKQ